MSRVLATVAAVAVVVSSCAVNTNIALGHERRAVGPYTFVVGWINEPAYVNVANGLSLDVTETSGSKPVEGLASTLRAEVIVGGGAKKLSLDLATEEATPGHYEGRFIPTKAGDYIFHILGDAGSTKVPDRVPANADLAARLDQLQTLVIAGIVLGGLALLASAAGLVTGRR